VTLLDGRVLAERATDKFLWQQRASAEGRAAARRGLDAMLAAARPLGPSFLVNELVRLNAMLRILGEDPADVAESGALLTELAELAELSGDARMVGEVAAMRAHARSVRARRGRPRRRRHRVRDPHRRPRARRRRGARAGCPARSTAWCWC
jgi:hypothetical protein